MLRHVTAGLALALLSGPAWALGYCANGSLNILLTNDDGYQAPGIRALQTALTEAGHRVVMVAPLQNQSGGSTSITTAPLAVTNPEPNVYAVAGTPATTTLLGVTAIFGSSNRPNLVVSGINEGANIGSATPLSGTVGATIAAITQFAVPIAAIAVSTDLVNADAHSPENAAHFADVADFTARLVDQLVGKSCRSSQPLLPWRVALNVNYPPLAPAQVAGVRQAVQGRYPAFTLGYRPIGGGTYIPDPILPPSRPDVPNADTTLFGEGFVTIVPINGDYTASLAQREQVSSLVWGLLP